MVSVAFRSAPAQKEIPPAPVSDQHARVVVGLEAQIRLVQRRRRRAVDGVAPVLAVDRDQRGRAASLVADGVARTRSAARSRPGRYQPPRQ